MSYTRRVLTKRLISFFVDGKSLTKIVGGIQHSTGNGNDSVLSNFNYFNTTQVDANAHFFIDASNIFEFVETNQEAYHALYPANGERWGCEMCETTDLEKFKQIWDRQVWLWTYLFTQVANPRITKITTDILRSHYEENQMNHPNDPNAHGDPNSYFEIFGKKMEDMRMDVQNAITEKISAEAKIIFKDMVNNMGEVNYANDDVNYLYEKGIVKGKVDVNGNHIYDPNASITRAESAILIARTLRRIEESLGGAKETSL